MDAPIFLAFADERGCLLGSKDMGAVVPCDPRVNIFALTAIDQARHAYSLQSAGAQWLCLGSGGSGGSAPLLTSAPFSASCEFCIDTREGDSHALLHSPQSARPTGPYWRIIRDPYIGLITREHAARMNGLKVALLWAPNVSFGAGKWLSACGSKFMGIGSWEVELAAKVGSWEQFTVKVVGQSISLLSTHGRWLSCDAKGKLAADKKEAGATEALIFDAPYGGGVGVKIRTSTGRFLSVGGGTRVDATPAEPSGGGFWLLFDATAAAALYAGEEDPAMRLSRHKVQARAALMPSTCLSAAATAAPSTSGTAATQPLPLGSPPPMALSEPAAYWMGTTAAVPISPAAPVAPTTPSTLSLLGQVTSLALQMAVTSLQSADRSAARRESCDSEESYESSEEEEEEEEEEGTPSSGAGGWGKVAILCMRYARKRNAKKGGCERSEAECYHSHLLVDAAISRGLCPLFLINECKAGPGACVSSHRDVDIDGIEGLRETMVATLKHSAAVREAKKQPEKRSTEKRSTEKRSTEKGSTKKSSTEKGSTEKSSTKKSSTEKGSTEKSSTKKSSTEKGSTEKSSTEKSSTKKSSTEKGSTEKGSTEKSSTEKSSTEKGSTEKSSTKKSSTEKSSERGGKRGGGGGGGEAATRGGRGGGAAGGDSRDGGGAARNSGGGDGGGRGGKRPSESGRELSATTSSRGGGGSGGGRGGHNNSGKGPGPKSGGGDNDGARRGKQAQGRGEDPR